jgi:hypothetical protein
MAYVELDDPWYWEYEKFRSFPDGWNGERTDRTFSDSFLKKTVFLLQQIREAGGHLPTIIPMSPGGLCFQWDGLDGSLHAIEAKPKHTYSSTIRWDVYYTEAGGEYTLVREGVRKTTVQQLVEQYSKIPQSSLAKQH